MPTEPLHAEEILIKLQELTQGLFYISESDYPLEVVRFSTDSPEQPTETAILKLVGKENATLKMEGINHFFRNMVQEEVVGEADAARYKELVSFLEQNLPDVKVYLVGEEEVTALALGKINNTEYGGLKTTLIQVY